MSPHRDRPAHLAHPVGDGVYDDPKDRPDQCLRFGYIGHEGKAILTLQIWGVREDSFFVFSEADSHALIADAMEFHRKAFGRPFTP